MVEHVPVLLERCVELLTPALELGSLDLAVDAGSGPILIDGTLGLGGHTEAVLQALPQVTVVGIDADPNALAKATARLAPFEDRFVPVHAWYDQMADVAEHLGVAHRVWAVLLDLGVSSMQLDRVERGFAYSVDAPLDMRMNPQMALTAADVLATYSGPDLTRILRAYGEERYAPRIAKAIVAQRDTDPIERSSDLVALLTRVIPAASQRSGGHPAKRTFQALRIEVNDELGGLVRALPQALNLVPVGGRVAVMAYQSLEDRIVKRTFASACEVSAPPDLPVIPDDSRPRFQRLTRGAEVASTSDISANPRSASVRLRAVERVRENP